jgi:pyruvate kinase
MQKVSNTKIVCTIGPASWDEDTLREMIDAGMRVARINASFADEPELTEVSTRIRSISPRVAIMLDTKGHKIRVDGFDKEFDIKTGENITLVSQTDSKAPKGGIVVTYPTLHKDVVVGTKILLDDGTMTLEVIEINGSAVICKVIAGGTLKPKKTVNIPNVHLTFPRLSDKDKRDIKTAVKLNFDLISVSFVRDANDIKAVRKIMGHTDIKLIAKVEDHEGVTNFDEILNEVDGIMVPRGDLGVELPLEDVPILQKQMIAKCREAGKPVIVATQMLESMREHNRPTRAEVSDVANAVMDGADAVMLSAETSTGNYPVESVKTMVRIAKKTESVLAPNPVLGRTEASEETDVLCRTVASLVDELKLKGVIVISKEGKTVRSLSRHRLKTPIWEISANPRLIRQSNLLRGVTGFYIKDFKKDRDESIRRAIEVVYAQGSLELLDKVAIISGSSITNKDTNSILEISTVKNIIG